MGTIQSDVKSKGAVRIELRGPDGELKSLIEKDNLIVTVGNVFIASAVIAASASPFNRIAVGSGVAAPSLADTALGAELVRVAATTSLAGSIASFAAAYPAGVGTGVITEAGIFNAPAAGSMFSRVSFPAINKAAVDTLTITWNITAG